MKFSPPRFLASEKLYISDIQDGDEFLQRVDSVDIYTLPEQNLTAQFHEKKESYISILMEGTKGWFSKPLTAQWLRSKCAIQMEPPANESLQGFRSGSLRWKIMQLQITKEAFHLRWKIVEVLPDPVIELEEDLPVEMAPPEESDQPTGSDRASQKARVMAARRRAARALYKAERLIQEYCAIWGEDTDWEDEESDASSGS